MHFFKICPSYALIIGLKYLRSRETLTSRTEPPRGWGVSARIYVFKPILGKSYVFKDLGVKAYVSKKGRRRRPNQDLSGSGTREIEGFWYLDAQKTSSFCAPRGANTRISFFYLQSTEQYEMVEYLSSVNLVRMIALCTIVFRYHMM